jgi:Zn finger protein HypA/HybF involved in hydrogenase expression
MTDIDELYTVSCVNCNDQIFKFSKKLLENYRDVYLKCPKCKAETQVNYDGERVTIEKF